MLSPKSQDTALAPGLDLLDRAAFAYLALPLVIFLATWLQWWMAVPLLICTAYSFRPMFAALPAASRMPVTPLQCCAAVIVGCGWTVLGGADHLVFANADWHVRDAVLHDLVFSPWPVGYGAVDGEATLLRAPLAFYLPAALVGKGLGLSAAHIAMGLWTAAGATLFLLQVLSLTPSRLREVVCVTLVVILFSGLDIVGSLLNDGPRFRYDWNLTTHLEWWAGKFQYSSMSTQLFWVPNHALGGWLCIGLLCRSARIDSDSMNSLLPLSVVALALWSPLTAIGLVPFVLLRVATQSITRRSWRLFHPVVWAPAAVIGLVILAYLILDPGGISKGVAVGGKDASPALDLLQQAQFFLLEAGFIGAAILAIRRSAEVALALVILALLPLIYLGPANDLVMRASIPSLAVLSIGACLALFEPAAVTATLRKRAALIGLLAVGAVTPLAEISRAVFLPAWPINKSATVIGVNCGRFAPHYVARLHQEVIGRMLRPIHAIDLGPQGSASCSNPALELMWGWRFFPSKELRVMSTDAQAQKTQETRVAE